MALELTADGINEFYEVIHGIDNSLDDIHDSLDNIHDSLDALNGTMADVVALLEIIANNLGKKNLKEV